MGKQLQKSIKSKKSKSFFMGVMLLTLIVLLCNYNYASSQVKLTVSKKKKLEIAISKNDSNMDITNFQTDVYNKLKEMNVDTNLVTFHDTQRETISTSSSDAATIFNSWGRIGYPGRWSYNASSGVITNAENTDNFTGFYYPNSFSYQDITLSYDNRTTDGDDDMMGAMIRFNLNPNGTVTSYVFGLDRHDNGGGIGNRSL